MTEIADTVVEAPDYDSDGHFYPNIHDEDIEHDVHRVFPSLTERSLKRMVVKEFEPPRRRKFHRRHEWHHHHYHYDVPEHHHHHRHRHEDDDDEKDDDDDD